MKAQLRAFDGTARDWALSNAFKYISHTQLPQIEANKSRMREQEYFNPDGIDVYREEEVVYELTLLKQMQKRNNNEEASSYHMMSLENKDGQSVNSYSFGNDMVAKQRKISDTLRLLKINLQLERTAAFQSTETIEIQEPSLDHLMELFHQCKHLYSIYGEVKKILTLILRQDELFNTENSVIQTIMKKQSKIENQGYVLSEKDE